MEFREAGPNECTTRWYEADVIDQWVRDGKLTLAPGELFVEFASEVSKGRLFMQNERDRLRIELAEARALIDNEYALLREKVLNEKSGELVRLHRMENALDVHRRAHAMVSEAIRLAQEGKGPDGRPIE
jgi:hypothetical protein